MEAAHILKRFARTSWGKKLAARRIRARQTDFARFVAMKVHRGSFFNPSKAARKAAKLAALANRKKLRAASKAKKVAATNAKLAARKAKKEAKEETKA